MGTCLRPSTRDVRRSCRLSGLALVVTLVVTVALLAVAVPAMAEDVTPPQVLSFSLAPAQVDTDAADQTVTVTMRITDDQAGVAVEGDYGSTSNPVNLSLKPLIGTQYVWFRLQRTSGTDRDGIYTGTTTIPRGSKEGVWQVAWLRLGDKIGNFEDLNAQDLVAKFGAGCERVTNAAPTSDSAPPQVLSFSLNPSEVNSEAADQTVTVTMRITDDQAGVAVEGDYGSTSNPVNLSLKPLIGTQYVWFRLQRTSGTDRDGIYTGTTTIPRGSKEGAGRSPGCVSATRSATSRISTPRTSSRSSAQVVSE